MAIKAEDLQIGISVVGEEQSRASLQTVTTALTAVTAAQSREAAVAATATKSTQGAAAAAMASGVGIERMGAAVTSMTARLAASEMAAQSATQAYRALEAAGQMSLDFGGGTPTVGAAVPTAEMRQYQIAVQNSAASNEMLSLSATESASAMGVQATAATRTAAAEDGLSAATENHARGSKQANVHLAKTANLISDTAFAVVAGTPALGEFGTKILMVGSSAMQLTASMGWVGLALGGVVAVLPSVINYFAEMGGAADSSARAVADLGDTIDRYVSELEKKAQKAQRLTQVLMGQATSEQTEATRQATRDAALLADQAMQDIANQFQGSTRNQIMALHRGLTETEDQFVARIASTANITREHAGRIAAVVNRFREMVRENAAATQQSIAIEEHGTAETFRVQDQARQQQRDARRSDWEQRQREAETEAQRELDRQQRLMERLASMTKDAESRNYQDRLRRAREMADAELTLQTRMKEKSESQLQSMSTDVADAALAVQQATLRGIDATIAALQRESAVRKDAKQTQIADSSQMLQILAASSGEMIGIAAAQSGAIESAIVSALQGTDTLGNALKRVAQQAIASTVARSIVESVFNLASGLAALANPLTAATAPGYFAASAAFAGVAAVAGTAGAAIGFGGGGGGKGGGGAGGGGGATRPAAPASSQSREQTVVVNVGTFPVSTAADVGRAVEDALAAARRRDGDRI